MELTTSAHADTFPRDHLPPHDQWPHLDLDLPELRYPGRLNCATELLDRTAQRLGADRPAFRTADGTVWSYGELRGHVDRIARVLTDELGVVPGNRVLLRGPTTPWLAACWLAVVKAGTRRRRVRKAGAGRRAGAARGARPGRLPLSRGPAPE